MSISKEQLLKNLRRIQKAICAYQSSKFCDCKYMQDSDKDSRICSLHEEGSGCPEVSRAIELIEAMPNCDECEHADKKEEKPKSSRRMYSLAGNNCCFECSSCSSKSGAPELCTVCIRKREICQTKHKGRK
jgi:hypothetical protein